MTPERSTDLTPFIDKMAEAMYLDLDSHADRMTWAEYKAEDPWAATDLYARPLTRYVLRALPLLHPTLNRAIRDAVAADIEAERDRLMNPPGLLRKLLAHGQMPTIWSLMTRAATIARSGR